MAKLPECPRGHAESKVVLDGSYGREGRRRQRYRCQPADGSKRHVFTTALPRTRSGDARCEACDNPVAPHEGPMTVGRSSYLVREVAGALVAAGRGETYTNVAQRLRRGAWGPAAGSLRRGVTTVESGQTVSDWIAGYAPVVAAEHQETAWPQTIVCDSTRFMYTDRWTGSAHQLFCVLAVWGYPEGDQTGLLYKLVASPQQDAAAWEQLLRSLPGKPESVVCDRDYAIIGGVQATWGRGRSAVPVHLCEHHLYQRAKLALTADKVTAYGDPLHTLLNDAFTSAEGWAAFHDAANAAGGSTAKWVRHWNKRMTAQARRRPDIPAHYANGAVEDPLHLVRQMLERRSWTLRNRERLNLLLELVRLRINGVDQESAYTRTIRKHLEDNGGRPTADWRAVGDPRQPGKQVSTSSLRAWVA